METQGNENVRMSSQDFHEAKGMLFPTTDSVEKIALRSLQTSGGWETNSVARLIGKS